MKLFGWDKDDKVTAFGDNGDVIVMNSNVPDEVEKMDRDGVWAMCQFAAKKLNMDPIDFYIEFLHEDSVEEGEMKDISRSEVMDMEKELIN